MCSVCVIALSDWLPALGYAYKNLVSPITSDNKASRTGPCDHVTGTVTSSCEQRGWSERLKTTPCERLGRCVRSVDIADSVSVSERAYVFGAGVMIATDCDSGRRCDHVTVSVLEHVADDDLSQLAVLLLNNSLFLSTYLSVTDRRQVHHYIKPSSSPAQLARLIARSDVDGVTLTVTPLSRHDVQVSVMNDVAVLHVRHVTWSHVDVTSERRHLDADVTRRMTSG